MDIARVKQEVGLIASHYSEATLHESQQWVFLPNWKLHPDVWDRQAVDLSFQIPTGYPGQAPYGFYLFPSDIRLSDGTSPKNAQVVAETPYEGHWLKFSWVAEHWTPASDYNVGSNLLNFLNGIRYRLTLGR